LKKSDNVISIVMGIIFFIIFISWKHLGIYWGAICAFLNERGIPPVLALGVAIVLIVTVPISLFLHKIKRTILKAMPEKIKFTKTSPEKFAALDLEALARYTEAFESLGFKILLDYTADIEEHTGNRGFARLFSSPDLSCFAEANQVFPLQGEVPPLKAALISYFPKGWCLSTTDRPPDGATFMIRLPRSLWSSHPDAPPAQLVAFHLERRNELVGSLHFTLSRDLSEKRYFAEQNSYTALRKEAFKKKNMLVALLEFLTFNKETTREWMGDFHRQLAAKRGRGDRLPF
jgi:hypothetical protein